MYLSRLSLSLLDRKTQRALSDAYEMHCLVMRGFKAYANAKRVLYRVEPQRDSQRAIVIVQSPLVPDWYDLSKNTGVEMRAFDSTDIVSDGRVFTFRLRANPVVTRGGKRYGLIGEDAQRAWLQKKECGIDFESFNVIDEGYVISKKKGFPIHYKSVRFEGRIRIVDPQKAIKALEEGIGPAKGFGFGLLSLAKAE